MRFPFKSPWIIGLLALASAGLLLGCRSSKQPGSYSHASATIRDRSDEDIRRVTTEVFVGDGFAPAGTLPDLLVFERLGSRSDAVKWGGLDGSGVVIRAKVRIRRMPDGSRLLQCDVFYVRDAGDKFFESEGRMTMVNKSPYRRLMEQVRERLGQK